MPISKRAASAVALALVLALVGAGAPAAVGAEPVKAMWGPATRNGVSLFPAFHELGVKIYEDDLHWNLIARRRPRHPRDPSDPAYVWPAEVTSAVAQAKRYGMRVALADHRHAAVGQRRQDAALGAPPPARLRRLRDRRVTTLSRRCTCG